MSLISYISRFAPSPTGRPLHFGSLIAAVASYCNAKSHGRQWLLRMKDLDKPCEIAGAADAILRSLDAFDFEWDAPVTYQNQRADIYAKYFYRLQHNGLVYSCTCNHKKIADSAVLGGLNGVTYPKTRFNKFKFLQPSENNASASHIDSASWRINVDNVLEISFVDLIQGNISQLLPT